MFSRNENLNVSPNFGLITEGFNTFFTSLKGEETVVKSKRLFSMEIDLPTLENAGGSDNQIFTFIPTRTSIDMGVTRNKGNSRVALIKTSATLQTADGFYTESMFTAIGRDPKVINGLRDAYSLISINGDIFPQQTRFLEQGVGTERTAIPVFMKFSEEQSEKSELFILFAIREIKSVVDRPVLTENGAAYADTSVSIPLDQVKMGLAGKGFDPKEFFKKMDEIVKGEPEDITIFDLDRGLQDAMDMATGGKNQFDAQWINRKTLINRYPYYPEMPENK